MMIKGREGENSKIGTDVDKNTANSTDDNVDDWICRGKREEMGRWASEWKVGMFGKNKCVKS